MKIAEDESLRPHLLRAIYEWCLEKKYTPYLAAQSERDDVLLPPSANSADKVIVLSIAPEAVRDLAIGDSVSFTARFHGATFHVMLPVGAVVGIYARETGGGLSFNPLPPHPMKPVDKLADKLADKPFLQVI
ncbi:MAG: stringent starvation protein B [Gammaproteobacteria bacterium WSBS_2016_MAG_OTU1]